MKRNTSTVIQSIVTVVLIAIATLVWFSRTAIQDRVLAYTYTPDTNIARIRDRVDFTDDGQLLFYASQPSVETSDTFNTHCQRQEQKSAILGCYTNRKIYIYDIDSSELDGIQEVTAAHEMLHAAWERLSDGERERLGVLLDQVFQRVADDDLRSRMEYYDRQQPGERSNELHSILATEYLDVGDELEEYFATYFVDRRNIVRIHARYNAVFKGLQEQSDALYEELTVLSESIERQSIDYNQLVAELNADIDALNDRANNVDRTSVSAVNAFNADRQELIERSRELDVLRTSLNSLIDTYNQKRDEYNSIVAHTQELQSSIDSLAPAPSI